jgi:cytochrome c oxidase assembly protein subunit 15
MDFRDAFVLWRGLDIDYTGGVLANPARIAIHVTHRIGALLAGSILIVVGALSVATVRNRRVRLIGGLLMAAVALQICIGVAMVHFGMPLPLATLHNAGAALLVICTVALLRTLWPESALSPAPAAPAISSAPAISPASATGVVPLADVHRPR